MACVERAIGLGLAVQDTGERMEAALEHEKNSTQHGWALKTGGKPAMIGDYKDTLHPPPRSIGKPTTCAAQSPARNQKENSQNNVGGLNYTNLSGFYNIEEKRPLAACNRVNPFENNAKIRIVEVRTSSSHDDGTIPNRDDTSLTEELDALKERVKSLLKENKSLRKTSRVLVRAVEEAHEAESNLLRKLERQDQSIGTLRALCRSMMKEQSGPNSESAQLAKVLDSDIVGLSHKICSRSNTDRDTVWRLGDAHLKPLYKLGEGTYGKVFAALDMLGYWKSCGKEVAVKFVPRSYTKSFHQEQRFLRNFGPIGITPKLLATVVTKDFNVIVMEKGNATLSSPSNVLLWRGIPKEEDVCKVIIKELIGLLSVLHDEGYVHLDIKADNILLDQDCKMLLCDGGLSNTIEDMRYQRIRWQGLEHSWHLAPEIRSGAMLFHPEAADMYSAGSLLAGLRLGGLPAEKMTKQKMQDIVQEAFPFDIYPEAHGFLKALLCISPGCRLTAKQALKHPWLKDCDIKSRNIPLMQSLRGSKKPLDCDIFLRGMKDLQVFLWD